MNANWVKAARLIARPLKRVHGLAAMKAGRISSVKPISTNWGYDRGTPIDRFYIEAFLDRHRTDVKGRVLEIQEDDYSRRFGGSAVTGQDVLDLSPTNAKATIVGDLSDPKTLPEGRFDCILLTQTLHLVFDMAAALANIRRALRPNGVALITVPGITPIDPRLDYAWYWSLTDQSLRKLLDAAFDPAKVEVETFGNLFSATAFLHAAAVQEVPERKLRRLDPRYPVTITARAVA